MVFERTEHEPEEDDPEADFHDPETDSLTIPAVDVPAIETPEDGGVDVPTVDTDPADVPADVRKNFWLLVGTVKVATLSAAVGVFLLAFGFDRTYWLALLVGALALVALAWRRYWKLSAMIDRLHTNDDRTGESADDEPDASTTSEP